MNQANGISKRNELVLGAVKVGLQVLGAGCGDAAGAAHVHEARAHRRCLRHRRAAVAARLAVRVHARLHRVAAGGSMPVLWDISGILGIRHGLDPIFAARPSASMPAGILRGGEE